MENIDKNSVFWNHMSEEEKKFFLELSNNSQNIQNEEHEHNAEENNNKKTQEIIETDIKASDKIMNEINELHENDDSDESDDLDATFHFNWEEEFFKKFDWLDQPTMHKTNEMMTTAKYQLFLDCCKILENQFSITNEPDLVDDHHFNKLYMYFISLEDEHLFLYTDFKKDYEQVMERCLEKYDYVKLHKPQKVTFVMEIHDFYDVDKYVKMFMHMFGIDKTRGGSYTNIELSESFIETIHHEKGITTIDYYLQNNNKA